MLTVFCVCVGDKYDVGYVYALRDMVKNNLTIEHEFKCITTKKLEGIQTITPPVPYQEWWSKFGLFYPGVSTGPSLYFDLDTVIVGNIDYLVEYTKHKFAAPENWAQSGHKGIQSTVMAWSGSWNEPYERVKEQWPEVRSRLWGDQEFLTEMLGDDWVKMEGIRSYKYHCQNALPKEARVVAFHGKPDYPEVDNEWIRECSGGWYDRDPH